jgi:hypothetical protein
MYLVPYKRGGDYLKFEATTGDYIPFCVCNTSRLCKILQEAKSGEKKVSSNINSSLK